jgi:heat shock protein HslJ
MKRFAALLLMALLALGVAALSGCGPTASNAKLLEAHQWRVTKLGDTPYTGTAPITSAFSAGKISGSTGVNLYSGTYEAPKGNDISIKLGPMTLIAGAPAAMAAEQQFIKALGAAASYAADDESLTLFDSAGASLVTYAVEKPTTLVGTKWKMMGYNNGRGALQSAISTSEVTAVFAADGTVSGNGGVNSYHGSYTTSGSNGIAITGVASTKMMGPEEVQAQEDAYLAAIQKATVYKIEAGDQLWLRDSSGAAMAQYVPE